MRLAAIGCVALLVGVGGCSDVGKLAASTGSSAEPAGPPPVEVREGGVAAKAPACAPIDKVKLAPFTCEDAALPDVPLPALEDPSGSLAHFYARLAELARGRAKDHVRVAMYGDSNLTTDETTGRMRRKLQARFGDAGHGFVALARPWPWYRHSDVRHDGSWRDFRQIAVSTHKTYDGHYGFANIASETGSPGAVAFVSTTPRDADSPIGWKASRFDVFYMKRPDGGRFDLTVDDAVVREVDTRAKDAEAAFERVDTTDAQHELKVRIKGHGTVRLFGVAVERGAPSVVVDALGTGALNMEQMTLVNRESRRAQLARRGYDLVIIHLGTNMYGTDADHRRTTKVLIEDLRAALPDVSILVMSPPDSAEPGTTHADPHIAAIAPVLRAIAAENGAAYWDFLAAMGGSKSIFTFVKKGMAWNDYIHLTKPGHELMADRMLCALSDGLGTYLAKHTEAGCTSPRGSAETASPQR